MPWKLENYYSEFRAFARLQPYMRAILAVMVGTGPRRSESANLEFRHIQQREWRWVIVDLVGKGNRVRTVPILSWVKVAIDEWAKAVDIKTGGVFRGVYHYGNKLLPDSEGITPQTIYMLNGKLPGRHLRRKKNGWNSRGQQPWKFRGVV